MRYRYAPVVPPTIEITKEVTVEDGTVQDGSERVSLSRMDYGHVPVGTPHRQVRARVHMRAPLSVLIDFLYLHQHTHTHTHTHTYTPLAFN